MATALSASPRRASSFVRTLIANFTGLVVVLGLFLLVAMVWQGIASTNEASKREIDEALDRAVERLQILVRATEMTAESVERAARTTVLTGATLRATLENSLAAFEQRPELSYVGIVLPDTGEYGNLERTAAGEILLWLFPGTRPDDPVIRIYVLTEQGFVLREERPTDGYDPRVRPFYLGAVDGPAEGTWIPAYPWIVHDAENSQALWGLSFVKAIRDGAGRLVCVLDADFDLPALNDFLKSIAAEYRCDLKILELGEAPRLIGDTAVGREPLPLNHELAGLVGLPERSWADQMELDGENRWAAGRHLQLKGSSSWMVVASRLDSVIAPPLRQQLYQVVGMGIVITAGLVLVSVRIARRIGRPLVELEKHVADLGRRKTGASLSPFPTARTDGFRETDLLGAAFDRMALTVQQRESELALKATIVDSTSTAIVSLDPQLVVVEWNAAAERLFGLERSRVLGHPVTEAVRSPHGTADWTAILSLPGTAEFRFVGARGAFDAERRIVSFIRGDTEIRTVFVNDITERKRAETALQESLARFHAAARATGDVIWDWDLATNDIWWNENYQTLFGYAAGEIGASIVESWNQRIHPDDHDRVVAHIHAIVDGSQETWTDEYRFRRRDGSWAHVFDRGHVLRNPGGRGIRMIGAMQDITERKETQARLLGFKAELEQRVADRTRELQILNQELESFCYSVSHDLRAPLRGIAGFTEIINREYAGSLDATAKNYLARVLAATGRMGELIDDLLNLSRVSREEMRRETVDLSAIANEVLAQLRDSSPNRRVETVVEDGLIAVGDSRLVRIMLENLLGNAWKFTAKNPAARIAFSAERRNGKATAFIVSDNGAGFDMRFAGKLFGPFQRLHRATEFPGTGIGLATVQRIVQRHGGSISAHAELGKGATFRFSFDQHAQ